MRPEADRDRDQRHLLRIATGGCGAGGPDPEGFVFWSGAAVRDQPRQAGGGGLGIERFFASGVTGSRKARPINWQMLPTRSSIRRFRGRLKLLPDKAGGLPIRRGGSPARQLRVPVSSLRKWASPPC
jgi:hypothetical protein